MRAFILVVERDLHTRETIIDMCAALGYVGLGASTPTKGLKMLEMMVFQVILISPGATLVGEPSYAVEAKKIQPDVTVIMAAAVEVPEHLVAPIDAFLQKPFSMIPLMKTSSKILDESERFSD